MKPVFENKYTALQMQVINRLAEIEQKDESACAKCGGEDCICCPIYLDRQKWADPDVLFNEDDGMGYTHNEEQCCPECGMKFTGDMPDICQYCGEELI